MVDLFKKIKNKFKKQDHKEEIFNPWENIPKHEFYLVLFSEEVFNQMKRQNLIPKDFKVNHSGNIYKDIFKTLDKNLFYFYNILLKEGLYLTYKQTGIEDLKDLMDYLDMIKVVYYKNNNFVEDKYNNCCEYNLDGEELDYLVIM